MRYAMNCFDESTASDPGLMLTMLVSVYFSSNDLKEKKKPIFSFDTTQDAKVQESKDSFFIPFGFELCWWWW